MPTALVIRHERYETIAGFRAPIVDRGYDLVEVEARHPDFTAIDLLDPDLLVLMGGSMGVYEQDRHPWLGSEIVRIAQRIAADRPTLGVCLGSQIMAAAMGARVYPGPVREVGFSTLSLTAAGRDSPLSGVADVPVLHWHGDTFDLPDGVTLLASSCHYAHQAFSRGRNQLALQFHPEMGEDEDFSSWLQGGASWLEAAGADLALLAADYDRLGPACAAAGRRLLSNWLAAIDE